MADSPQDKTAWRRNLKVGSLVDVLDHTGDKWRTAVVIDGEASEVYVQFVGRNIAFHEWQWLPRDSPRLAPPTSKFEVKSEPRSKPTAPTRPTTTDAGGYDEEMKDGGGEECDEFDSLWRAGLIDGQKVEIGDCTLKHWYEARVLVREPDRVLACGRAWPLSHSEWLPLSSDRVALPGSHLGRWRSFKTGQAVQVGFRNDPDSLGASYWTPGRVVSVSQHTFGVFRIEIEWREQNGVVHREWRHSLDDLLAPPGVPMPCMNAEGVVFIHENQLFHEVAVEMPPTHGGSSQAKNFSGPAKHRQQH